MTKLTWDNAVLIGPEMAQRLDIKSEDVVELELNGKKVTGAVWIQAGHPDNSVTITLGYGRKRAGRVGTAQGFNAYALRTTAAPWIATGVKIRKTGDTYKLASTQGMQSMDTPDGGHRPLVRETTLEEYRKEPNFAQEDEPAPGLTLYEPYPYKSEDYAWGMTIDLNSCVGCNNCMLACQSENNIAVVGKEQVVIGRHMHWIRVDAYYQGDRDNPQSILPARSLHAVRERALRSRLPGRRHQPHHRRPERHGLQPLRGHALLLEQLSVQSAPLQLPALPGLGDAAIQDDAQSRRQRAQPRRHGKVHLLRAAHQRAPHRRRDSIGPRRAKTIRIGDELQTACQQSCPAGAIVFGNINDPNSKVSKLKAQSRNYSLLGELNTRPRTTYLAEVRNPNPELKG